MFLNLVLSLTGLKAAADVFYWELYNYSVCKSLSLLVGCDLK